MDLDDEEMETTQVADNYEINGNHNVTESNDEDEDNRNKSKPTEVVMSGSSKILIKNVKQKIQQHQ